MSSNAAFPWADFDSRAYFRHNYAHLRLDDRQILGAVRDFFAGTCRGSRSRDGLHGLDVGSGTNLYPALAMLPFCDQITLREHSASNVAWLEEEIGSYGQSWDPFWGILTHDPIYAGATDPRKTLASRARVVKGSVFGLPAGVWDLGTMFFVAESLTADMAEFRAATHRFLRALRPGSPFAAAFMENSTGYRVGEEEFPAVAITADDLRTCLAGHCDEVRIMRVDSDEPLRDGYTGMLVAFGWTRPDPVKEG